MANTTIQLKYSVVASNSPSSLANGEIAINGADGKLFYRTPAGAIQSIVTYPGPAGLNKEIQFNDSGVAGSNSALTFDKASASLNVTNINVTTKITTGSGTGGTIAGANTIYANNFVANTGGITTTGNSTLNGIVTVNYINATSVPNAAIEIYGANTKGGTSYFDFISANNRSAGTTNPSKWFRIDSNGKFQIINSAYTVNIFDLNDSGYLTIPGALQTSAYIQFSDGSKQYTANAGAGSSLSNNQILAGLQTVSATNNITFDYVATSNNGYGENFKVGDDAWIGDTNLANTIRIKGQQNSANAYIALGNNDGKLLGRAGSGALTFDSNTIWHAGNDGTGSGLDADLLDGLDSSSFANAAFANTDYTTISATAGVYGNAAFHPVVTLTANGRVSSITNTAIAIDTAAITTGTLADGRLPTKGTAGTYGNTTYHPVITTDAYGRVTAVTNTLIQSATTSQVGIVQLTDSISSTSTTTAATPNSVKTAYDLAATKFASSGGAISGDVSITGNLTLSGNLTSISANNIVIDDSVIYLANNNSANVSDIGFVGHFTDSKYQHTGLIRDASDGRWKLFSNVTAEPSTTIDFTNANYDILQIGRLESTTVNITSTSSSTSTSTGALTVAGGIGVAGNVYASAANITSTSSSTSKSTGALVVAGGVGVSGDLYAGNSLVVDNGTYGNVTISQFASVYGQAYGANPYSIVQVRSNDFKTGMGMQTYAGLNGLVYSNTGIQFNTSSIVRDKDFPTGGTNAGQFAANGAFIAQASLASTSNASGSIQVVGGVGVKGNVIADNVYVGANPVATIPDVLALAIALG